MRLVAAVFLAALAALGAAVACGEGTRYRAFERRCQDSCQAGEVTRAFPLSADPHGYPELHALCICGGAVWRWGADGGEVTFAECASCRAFVWAEAAEVCACE